MGQLLGHEVLGENHEGVRNGEAGERGFSPSHADPRAAGLSTIASAEVTGTRDVPEASCGGSSGVRTVSHFREIWYSSQSSLACLDCLSCGVVITVLVPHRDTGAKV